MFEIRVGLTFTLTFDLRRFLNLKTHFPKYYRRRDNIEKSILKYNIYNENDEKKKKQKIKNL